MNLYTLSEHNNNSIDNHLLLSAMAAALRKERQINTLLFRSLNSDSKGDPCFSHFSISGNALLHAYCDALMGGLF